MCRYTGHDTGSPGSNTSDGGAAGRPWRRRATLPCDRRRYAIELSRHADLRQPPDRRLSSHGGGAQPRRAATGTVRLLDDIVGEGTFGPVETQRFELGTVITIGGRAAVVLTPSDIDELAGETLDQVVNRTVERLQAALVEAKEARSPRQLLLGLALAVTALVVAILALWGLARLHRLLIKRLVLAAERTLAKSGLRQTVRQSRLIDLELRLLGSVMATLGLVIVYVTTTFILRRFPYTRPWGESMRGLLLQAAGGCRPQHRRRHPGHLHRHSDRPARARDRAGDHGLVSRDRRRPRHRRAGSIPKPHCPRGDSRRRWCGCWR